MCCPRRYTRCSTVRAVRFRTVGKRLRLTVMGLIRKTLHFGTLGAVAPHSETNRLLMQDQARRAGRPESVVRLVGTRRENSLSMVAAERAARQPRPTAKRPTRIFWTEKAGRKALVAGEIRSYCPPSQPGCCVTAAQARDMTEVEQLAYIKRGTVPERFRQG
jgi:hypothetical protein